MHRASFESCERTPVGLVSRAAIRSQARINAVSASGSISCRL